jgi:serralysin
VVMSAFASSMEHFDFSGMGSGEPIDLSALDADVTTAGDQAFHFVATPTTTFSGVAGELIWSQQDLPGSADDNTMVSGDVNGDGVADVQLELSGLTHLKADMFIL